MGSGRKQFVVPSISRLIESVQSEESERRVDIEIFAPFEYYLDEKISHITFDFLFFIVSLHSYVDEGRRTKDQVDDDSSNSSTYALLRFKSHKTSRD